MSSVAKGRRQHSHILQTRRCVFSSTEIRSRVRAEVAAWSWILTQLSQSSDWH